MPSSLRASWLRTLPLVILVSLAPACRGGAGDGDEVRDLVRREAEAFSREDLGALAGIWSQDKGIVLFDVEPPGRFQGWETIGRLYRSFFDRVSDVRIDVSELRVDVDGPIALATYDWAMTGKMGEYVLQDRGQATGIYRKEKDGWRLVHEHVSSLPPAGAAAPPESHPASTPAPGAPAAARPAARPAPSPAASP